MIGKCRRVDAAAQNDVNITAKQIELLTANDINREHQDSKDTKIGVFARVNSPIIDLVNNIDAARKSDGRLATMQGMAAGASAYQAASAISSMAKGPGSGSILSAEAGIGFAQDKSQYDGNSSTAVGSNISGGHNVTLTSTEGDIHGVQANLKAGDTLTLDSAKNIVLEAGKSTQSSDGKSSNVGAEVGVGVSVGAQTGVYVYGQVSTGSSKNSSDAAYSDILTDPNTKWFAQTGNGGVYTSSGKPATWVSYEIRDGVRIRVIYQPATGKVRTAFPQTQPIPPSLTPVGM